VCSLDGATEDIGFMHFAMTESLFLTSRRHPLNAVEATRKALRRDLKIGSTTALLKAIVQQLVNAVMQHAENLAAHMDTIEERIAADNVSELRRTLGHVRRTTVRLHRQLVILRSLMHQFEHHGQLSTRAELSAAIERLGRRLAWLDAEIVALRDRAHLLQEETMLKNAEQTKSQPPSAGNRQHAVPAGEPGCGYLRHEFRKLQPRAWRVWLGADPAGRDFRRGLLAAAAMGIIPTIEGVRPAKVGRMGKPVVRKARPILKMASDFQRQ
jgi:hypothetical protein